MATTIRMRPLLIGAALFAYLALAAHARATTFGAKPNSLTLDAQHRIAQLEFSSLDARTNLFDVTVARWSQTDGQDSLVPVTDPIVVPPIFSISPYETVLLRLTFRLPPQPGPSETSYQVIIKEVLPKTASANARIVTVPLFVPPASPSTTAPTYTLKRAGSPNSADLIIKNASNTHIYIGKLSVEVDSKSLYEGVPAIYVLAGQSRTIPLKLTAALSGQNAELRYEDDRGDSQSATATITP